MIIHNLTPHVVRVVTVDGTVIKEFPSMGVCRCAQQTVASESIDEIPTTVTTYGEVVGLASDVVGGVFYVVSGLVKAALPHRTDLLVPTGMVLKGTNGEVVQADKLRDKTGYTPWGCTSLGR